MAQYTVVCRTASWSVELVSPCHGWAIAAEDHTGFHSYQLKTRRSGSSWHAITNWAIEEWKNIAWSDESRFLLRHADGRVRTWSEQHESMATFCLVSTVQAGGVMVWGMFFLAHVRSYDNNWATCTCPEEFRLFWRQRGLWPGTRWVYLINLVYWKCSPL